MPISTTLIKSIQDIMRQDAGVDGDAQRLAQLGWLLFLKIFDDQESELELLRDDYASPIPKKLRWRSWAADPEGITGDELLAFVNNTLFPSLKNLKADPRRNPRGFVVQSVFEDAFNYMKSGQLLRQVINRLHEIDFNDQAERHLFNDLYEKILRDLQSAGNAGEFYTPRAVTQFMVDQVAPKLGERILDPACGTGGFLACTLGHLYAQVRTVEDRQAWQEAVSGVEKKQLPHLLCITNMLLRGIEVPDRIRHDNTLSRPLRDYRPGDRVDVILTNPPFGGTEEPGIEANFPADVRTKETADLFLVLIMHLLKDGGRAAVVLPDGTLFGEGVKTRIKERLLTECDLHTIVRLPNGVFAPYTGIKTNLLFFTKGRPTQAVWYYEHPYPAGYKSYSKTKPIRIEEFEAEKAWWGSEANGFASRAESEFAWRVGIDEIKSKGFNLDLRNPYHPTEANHDLPDLHKQHMVLQRRANNSAIDLRNELTEALRGDSIAALTDQLELVAQSTNGVTKIRELVLNLAVRGKVVAQCAKDEPARVLLSKIREIKARKRGDGKSLPSSRERNDLSSGTHHFELPSGWEFASLSSLGWFGGGKTPSTSKRDYWDGDIPWVTPKDMKSSMVADSQDKVTLLAQRDGLTLYPPNSVMVVVRSGILRRTVPVAINSVKCTVNQDLKVLILALPPMAPYVRLMIRGFERFILDNLTKVGTTVESIRFDDFARQSFPIPPIAEQERIIRKVDHLLSLLDRLEEEQMQVSRVQALIADALINDVAGSRLIR